MMSFTEISENVWEVKNSEDYYLGEIRLNFKRAAFIPVHRENFSFTRNQIRLIYYWMDEAEKGWV